MSVAQISSRIRWYLVLTRTSCLPNMHVGVLVRIGFASSLRWRIRRHPVIMPVCRWGWPISCTWSHGAHIVTSLLSVSRSVRRARTVILVLRRRVRVGEFRVLGVEVETGAAGD